MLRGCSGQAVHSAWPSHSSSHSERLLVNGNRVCKGSKRHLPAVILRGDDGEPGTFFLTWLVEGT